ncbi:hypothetical protein BLNAU_13275 [Blattamonas nauphoetae]|uniref:Uncharacterized protein n=1 Tax=Blattamonas nauphoetae TaxID=2049346 RepID=A0ABQ9XK61_9EUKA|nr:hypothetical protein BLNAU_13275 [Blattamonas nauphoetae]
MVYFHFRRGGGGGPLIHENGRIVLTKDVLSGHQNAINNLPTQKKSKLNAVHSDRTPRQDRQPHKEEPAIRQRAVPMEEREVVADAVENVTEEELRQQIEQKKREREEERKKAKQDEEAEEKRWKREQNELKRKGRLEPSPQSPFWNRKWWRMKETDIERKHSQSGSTSSDTGTRTAEIDRGKEERTLPLAILVLAPLPPQTVIRNVSRPPPCTPIRSEKEEAEKQRQVEPAFGDKLTHKEYVPTRQAARDITDNQCYQRVTNEVAAEKRTKS